MGAYDSAYYNANFMIGFADKRGRAWHDREGFGMADGFDNHYPGAIPAEDIERRLFNWSPIEAPIYVETSMGMMPIDGRKAITRGEGGPVLGIHGEGYRVHDYRQELLVNLDRVVSADGIGYANAGLFNDGAGAYVQIELPEGVKTADGSVEVRPFILGSTSLDGSAATAFKLGYTNVVCDNTFQSFLSEAGKVYRRRHTKNSAFSLSTAREALDLLDTVATSAVRTIDHLLSIDVTDSAWSRFVEAHAPVADGNGNALSARSVSLAETKRQALTGLYRTNTMVAPWAGTAWGVMQAVNTYNEHMSIVRNVSRYERKITNAIAGKTADADSATLATLADVMGRSLAMAE